jgi:hypothetical protein
MTENLSVGIRRPLLCTAIINAGLLDIDKKIMINLGRTYDQNRLEVPHATTD